MATLQNRTTDDFERGQMFVHMLEVVPVGID